MKNVIHGGLAFLVAAFTVGACGSSGTPREVDQNLRNDVQQAILDFQNRDPGLTQWFESAHGYAVFPNVGKGGLIVGGAHGNGLVYEQGMMVGSSTLSQGTIGLQAGGQAYSEVIFFRDAEAMQRFKGGNFEFSGQASAVAVRAGASADANYEHGVAVFTAPKGGLMVEASIGGQRFTYHPLQ